MMVKEPVAGKVKSRLAATTGPEKACEIYRRLLLRTREMLRKVECSVRISFAEAPVADDIWSREGHQIFTQCDGDLGEKMLFDLTRAFGEGYQRVCLIGSDILDVVANDIADAFDSLAAADVVLGPAHDGGYYLIGCDRKTDPAPLFRNVTWGGISVLKETLGILGKEGWSYILLEKRRDVDRSEDVPKKWLEE